MRRAAIAVTLAIVAACSSAPRLLTPEQARAAIAAATGVQLRQHARDASLFAWQDGLVDVWSGTARGQNVALIVTADFGAAARAERWFDNMATWTYLHNGVLVVGYSHEGGTPDLTGQLEAALNGG